MNNLISDSPDPSKRQRVEETQKTPENRMEIGKYPHVIQPDTLNIGIQMKEFVKGPEIVDTNEWMTRMVYDLCERYGVMWTMMTYYCLDCESVKRINTSRSINQLGLPTTEFLTTDEEIRYSDPENHCKMTLPLVTYKMTQLTSPIINSINSWPTFIDTLISDFGKLKSFENLEPNNSISFENFRTICVPFFLNTYKMFDHFYSHHYEDICALKVLRFINSLFINTVLLADTHGIVNANKDTLGVNLYGLYLIILENEDKKDNKHHG